MPEKKQNLAQAADNVGQSGTDLFPTYQDEAGLEAKDKGTRPAPKEEPAPAPVELNHGEESPAAKAEREEIEKNPPTTMPLQSLPENQDETVK